MGHATAFPDQSPLDGSTFDDTIHATAPDEVAALAFAAHEAQRGWAEQPLVDRARALAELKPRLLERADEIAELLLRECGKPVEESLLAEVLPNADLVDYWVASIEELLERRDLDLDPLAFPGKAGCIISDPRGVVALITPWNYPVAIPLRTLVPALLAGNAVLFKPSEVTPRAGALVASLFDGLLPDGVLTTIQGGGDVGAAVVEADVDAVVFTGSVETGRTIATACAKRLIPASLELGGKDAAIVLEDADVERTAQGLVWGAFTNSGQNCASIERAYVHESIADELAQRIVEITKTLKRGRDVGTLTTDRQWDLVQRHVQQAVDRGADPLAGGPAKRRKKGLHFPPTVLRVDDEDVAVMTEETFGPVLPIVVFKQVDEAIDKTNASAYALTTSIWTRRIQHAHGLARRLRSGVVTINNHAFSAAIPSAPWTGTGHSGYGVTNSPHALSAFTRPRFVLEDRNSAARELWWYPYTPALRDVARAMADVRGGAGLGGRVGAIFKLASALPKRLFGG